MPRRGLYRLRDIPALLSTPVGRRKFGQLLWHSTWPVMRRVAGAHRRTLARNCRVVAVVGSLGKTTTSRAITCALGGDLGPEGGHNSRNGVAVALLRIGPKDRYAVIEVGIEQPGEMGPYAKMVLPDIAVVTSIGSEHNRSLGSLETTRSEKSLMVSALPPSGIAVLNGDDANVMWMADRTSARIITFGFEEGNDIRATDIHHDWPHGTRFRLHVDNQSIEMRTRLIGQHMVSPILATVAVARAMDVPMDNALARLRDLPPTTGRMEPLLLRDDLWLLRDDFKSTLETIYAALDTFAAIPAKRRVLVLGDISEPPGRQRRLYRALGTYLRPIVSRVIAVGQSFEKLTTRTSNEGLPIDRAFNAGTSVLKAIEELKRMIEPGDVVLIKGRDTQRLERIVCALQGRTVRCNIKLCRVKALPCSECPLLEKSGKEHRLT